MTLAPIDLHWTQQPGSVPESIERPATVEAAARRLAQDPTLLPVAGGTDLLLALARDRRGGRVGLLDMTRIEGFDTIEVADGAVTFGAGVTHNDIVARGDLRPSLLPLAQACLEIGSPQLRNRATIVGNVVTASPANDTISALLALDASLATVRVVREQVVRRVVRLQDFYSGFRSTVLDPGELVEAVTVPALGATRRGIWVKAGLRKHQAISVVHAGLVVDFDGDIVASARIALGSVAPIVELNSAAAEALVSRPLDQDSIASAADAAAESVAPIDDGRATADYRRSSVRTVVARGLASIAARTEADQWPRQVPLLSARSRRSVGDGSSAGIPVSADASPVVSSQAEVSVTVNGSERRGPVVGAGTLLDWLREAAGPGTKEGCAEGECGACTVQLDGDAVMSCLVPAVQADGASVTTIEGLAPAGDPNVMQQAFVERFAVQCGFCIPGFVMAAQSLADEVAAREPGAVPDREEIEIALSGNLCRCTGYYNIIDAVTVAIATGAKP